MSTDPKNLVAFFQVRPLSGTAIYTINGHWTVRNEEALFLALAEAEAKNSLNNSMYKEVLNYYENDSLAERKYRCQCLAQKANAANLLDLVS